MRLSLAIAVSLTLTLGCGSAWTPGQALPEDIAGEWTYRFADSEHQGGTIVIPNDSSPGAITLMTSDFWPGQIQYPGVLRGLARFGRYVCWADLSRQTFGIELTVYGGRLSATYFDDCKRMPGRLESASQRSVRDCEHTMLTLRRIAAP